MAIAISLREFLDEHHLPYETMQHRPTYTGRDTIAAAHRPGDQVAKCLLLKDGERYMLMVMPANRRLQLDELHRVMKRTVGLATEREVGKVFDDCELGAVPPAGPLYDVETVVDDVLLDQPEVYFSAGDHQQLIHMKQGDFRKLLGDAMHGRFSYPA